MQHFKSEKSFELLKLELELVRLRIEGAWWYCGVSNGPSVLELFGKKVCLYAWLQLHAGHLGTQKKAAPF